MTPFILTEQSLTVVINGKAQTMNRDHVNWVAAVAAVKAEEFESLEDLFDIAKAVPNYSNGSITVEHGMVYHQGEEIHNHVVERLLHFMKEGLPYQPLVRFLDKLMENPSRRAINELYSFLEHKNMPLTPDGNFLAYKSVNNEFRDWHTGNYSNKVGDVQEMKRSSVCDDVDQGCSAGFHAGSVEYARGFGSGGNLMIVEINPADVVSVPKCSDCQKLRTSKYKVVGHFEKKLEAPLVDDYYDGDEDWDSDSFNAGYDAALAENELN
tara:strand:+ start:124 stop:924 length:801 start_codon:yes stop_codon:yes gene_type:complete